MRFGDQAVNVYLTKLTDNKGLLNFAKVEQSEQKETDLDTSPAVTWELKSRRYHVIKI